MAILLQTTETNPGTMAIWQQKTENNIETMVIWQQKTRPILKPWLHIHGSKKSDQI